MQQMKEEETSRSKVKKTASAQEKQRKKFAFFLYFAESFHEETKSSIFISFLI
jgi:hypothetical protein